MKEKLKKIGIFGGSFNPVHHGHLIVARNTMERLSLDGILFVPNFQSPLKEKKESASAAQRLAMLESAIQGESGFAISSIELHRSQGVSYTIDTVRQLQREYPEISYSLLIGADSLETLHAWRDVETLKKIIPFIVMHRPGFQGCVKTDFVSIQIDISSSDIRKRCAEGKSIKYLVPESVRKYIEEHHVY